MATHFQCRFSSEKQSDKEAYEYLLLLQQKGLTNRQILKEALLALKEQSQQPISK